MREVTKNTTKIAMFFQSSIFYLIYSQNVPVEAIFVFTFAPESALFKGFLRCDIIWLGSCN